MTEIVKTIKEENVERLNDMNKYLTAELALKKPDERYVSDLQLSIKRLKLKNTLRLLHISK